MAPPSYLKEDKSLQENDCSEFYATSGNYQRINNNITSLSKYSSPYLNVERTSAMSFKPPSLGDKKSALKEKNKDSFAISPSSTLSYAVGAVGYLAAPVQYLPSFSSITSMFNRSKTQSENDKTIRNVTERSYKQKPNDIQKLSHHTKGKTMGDKGNADLANTTTEESRKGQRCPDDSSWKKMNLRMLQQTSKPQNRSGLGDSNRIKGHKHSAPKVVNEEMTAPSTIGQSGLKIQAYKKTSAFRIISPDALLNEQANGCKKGTKNRLGRKSPMNVRKTTKSVQKTIKPEKYGVGAKRPPVIRITSSQNGEKASLEIDDRLVMTNAITPCFNTDKTVNKSNSATTTPMHEAKISITDLKLIKDRPLDRSQVVSRENEAPRNRSCEKINDARSCKSLEGLYDASYNKSLETLKGAPQFRTNENSYDSSFNRSRETPNSASQKKSCENIYDASYKRPLENTLEQSQCSLESDDKSRLQLKWKEENERQHLQMYKSPSLTEQVSPPLQKTKPKQQENPPNKSSLPSSPSRAKDKEIDLHSSSSKTFLDAAFEKLPWLESILTKPETSEKSPQGFSQAVEKRSTNRIALRDNQSQSPVGNLNGGFTVTQKPEICKDVDKVSISKVDSNESLTGLAPTKLNPRRSRKRSRSLNRQSPRANRSVSKGAYRETVGSGSNLERIRPKPQPVKPSPSDTYKESIQLEKACPVVKNPFIETTEKTPQAFIKTPSARNHEQLSSQRSREKLTHCTESVTNATSTEKGSIKLQEPIKSPGVDKTSEQPKHSNKELKYKPSTQTKGIITPDLPFSDLNIKETSPNRRNTPEKYAPNKLPWLDEEPIGNGYKVKQDKSPWLDEEPIGKGYKVKQDKSPWLDEEPTGKGYKVKQDKSPWLDEEPTGKGYKVKQDKSPWLDEEPIGKGYKVKLDKTPVSVSKLDSAPLVENQMIPSKSSNTKSYISDKIDEYHQQSPEVNTQEQPGVFGKGYKPLSLSSENGEQMVSQLIDKESKKRSPSFPSDENGVSDSPTEDALRPPNDDHTHSSWSLWPSQDSEGPGDVKIKPVISVSESTKTEKHSEDQRVSQNSINNQSREDETCHKRIEESQELMRKPLALYKTATNTFTYSSVSTGQKESKADIHYSNVFSKNTTCHGVQPRILDYSSLSKGQEESKKDIHYSNVFRKSTNNEEDKSAVLRGLKELTYRDATRPHPYKKPCLGNFDAYTRPPTRHDTCQPTYVTQLPPPIYRDQRQGSQGEGFNYKKILEPYCAGKITQSVSSINSDICQSYNSVGNYCERSSNDFEKGTLENNSVVKHNEISEPQCNNNISALQDNAIFNEVNSMILQGKELEVRECNYSPIEQCLDLPVRKRDTAKIDIKDLLLQRVKDEETLKNKTQFANIASSMKLKSEEIGPKSMQKLETSNVPIDVSKENATSLKEPRINDNSLKQSEDIKVEKQGFFARFAEAMLGDLS